MTVVEDPGFGGIHATPDGWLHWQVGVTPPRPADATVPANIVGRWRPPENEKEEFDEFFDLEPSGSVSGQVWLFGAIPPLQVASGEWWWSQSASDLAISASLPIAAGFEDLSPIAFHVAYPLRVNHIGRDIIAGEFVFGSEVEEWYLTRI